MHTLVHRIFFTSSIKLETKDKVIYMDPIVVDNPVGQIISL